MSQLQYATFPPENEEINNIDNSKSKNNRGAKATRKNRNTKDNDLVNRIKQMQKDFNQQQNTKDESPKEADDLEKTLKYTDDEDDNREFVPPPYPEITQTKESDDSTNQNPVLNSESNTIPKIDNFHDPYTLSSELCNNYFPQGEEDYDSQQIASDNNASREFYNNIQMQNQNQNPSHIGNYTALNGQHGQTELLDKMNKIIQLLEEQQDERTNNVTEELVLYCFLGVFVIFVVDSFARAGKYTR